MNIRKLKREIKGVFVPPVREYYFGRRKFGCPYFYPWNFERWVFYFRILKERSPEDGESYATKYPHLKNQDMTKFSNLPMSRRNSDWIFKLFGKYIFLSIGWPIKIVNVELGWKDKFESPRYEWQPMFHIYFFNWQFVIFWNAPDGDNDKYYEQILWYLNYCNKDLLKSETEWGWVDYKTKKSTWNNGYLIQYNIR